MIRHEFVDDATHVANVHPNLSFDREQALAEEFVRSIGLKTDGIEPCPFSRRKRHEILFKKWGMFYALCPETWSLSLSVDPGEKVLTDYFHNSSLAAYRATSEYQDAVSSSRQRVWGSQLEWIETRIVRYAGKRPVDILDFGPKAAGWVNALADATWVRNLAVEAPLPPVVRREAGGQVDAVCLMDVLQRYFQPDRILRQIWEMLRPGGLLIGTCRAGSGFDILTLRESSESVFPFEHVALPSPSGMDVSLKRAGFQVLEVSTPGLLDAEFVKARADDIPSDQYFQRYLISTSNELALKRLQHFLQNNGLSSHLRFVAQKPA